MPLDGGADWVSVKLGEVTTSFAGGTPSRSKPEYFGPGVAWLKSGEVRAGRIEATGESITELGLKESAARVAKAGTPVIAMYGATAGVAGILGIDAALNQAVLAVIPRADVLDSEFCFRLLQSHTPRLLELTQGSGQPNLSKNLVEGLEVALPPLDEQRRIAEVLHSVDASLGATRAVSLAAQRASQTMRHELLWVSADGEITDLPEGWEARPLEKLASVERGKFSIRPRNDPRYFGGTTPFIQTGDITSAGDYLTSHTQTLNDLGVTVSRVFPAGTIMTTIAANIGDFTIATYPVACPDSVVGIEAGAGIHPFWLYSVLSCFKVALDRASTQNAQKNINLQTLRPLLIPVPPPSVMVELAETLEAASSAVREAEAGCRSIEALKRAIMDDLLSGRVRVPA